MFKDYFKEDSALKRLLLRIFWMTVSGALTALVIVLTEDYSSAGWYPFILFMVNTLKDIANKNLPNVPEGR